MGGRKGEGTGRLDRERGGKEREREEGEGRGGRKGIHPRF